MSNESIDISGLDRADILAALYNNSRPQGLGFMHYDAKSMTAAEARALLVEGHRFDYLKGRVMKINLRPDAATLDGRLYDRDNGQGSTERVVAGLRALGTSASP